MEALDMLWMLLGAILVFWMQAGFAMVETGFTRAKNAGNIIMKNLMDFALGSIIFWVIGYAIMYGKSVDGETGKLIGILNGNFFFGMSGEDHVNLIFQTVFCATSATIVSGAMAERTKFSSYLIYSVFISAVVYPISGHWAWGAGWLADLGFIDFAGSAVVHLVGGVAALVGAAILGPRIGKYTDKGESRAIPGHSLTLGALGVFILWMGWFGFNGGSTLGFSDDLAADAAEVFVTTNLAAAVAATATMFLTWIRYKKPDVSMTLNGALAGLVGITAGCNVVNSFGAVVIGLVCGILVVYAVEFIDKVLKIDDPVGASSVHGVCGAVGTLLVGLFDVTDGVFYGGGFKLLGVQALGVGTITLWAAVTMAAMFLIIKYTVGLRVSEAEEIAGLDIEEHGLTSSYADFMPVVGGSVVAGSIPQVLGTNAVSADVAIPVERAATPADKDAKLTKIVVIFKQSKFEIFKMAMDKIGITGMTVTNVLGFGMQKGTEEYYRGIPVDVNLLPKLKVEIVVAKIPVDTVVSAAKQALYTGHIGDGKIFVYNIENVIKVRTNEEGYDALQDMV